jgi:hypothetical protein
MGVGNGSSLQETVDLKLCIRYKKASTNLEEARKMGFSGGFEQEKPAKALLELRVFISTITIRVNP